MPNFQSCIVLYCIDVVVTPHEYAVVIAIACGAAIAVVEVVK